MNNEVETNSRPLASNRSVSSEKKLQEKLWNSNFILLLQGQLVSVFGDSVYDVAFRFWILTTTGSTALMGIFMAITVLPKVFISPFAGTFIDRHDRKKVLIIADAISGITILFIGIATLTGFIKIWMAVIVSIIVGICGCFFNPTINSTIPDIVPKSKLIKANSAFSLISTGNEMIGNAFGGFLVQILGAPILFLVNGISFIFSSITECFLKIPKVEASSEKISFFQDLKEGIHFVKNSKGLKYLYITIAFLNFFASMSMTLTLPLFETNSNLGVGLYGIAMAINTFGMFLGFTFLSVFKIKRERQFYMFIASGVIASMTMITVSVFLNICNFNYVFY